MSTTYVTVRSRAHFNRIIDRLGRVPEKVASGFGGALSNEVKYQVMAELARRNKLGVTSAAGGGVASKDNWHVKTIRNMNTGYIFTIASELDYTDYLNKPFGGYIERVGHKVDYPLLQAWAEYKGYSGNVSKLKKRIENFGHTNTKGAGFIDYALYIVEQRMDLTVGDMIESEILKSTQTIL